MRLPAHCRQPLGINMTPMIDVVFLLIIFFLVSSHLAKQETQVDLDLPAAKSGTDLDEAQRPRVTVNVLPDGTLLLSGTRVSPPELESRLGYERQRAGDDLEVRVRGDRSVAYRFIEPVLLASTRAGIWNVSIAVVREEDR